MTTVVFDGKVIAADRRINSRDVLFESQKLFLLKDCIIGIAGSNLSCALQFVKWFPDRDKYEPPDLHVLGEIDNSEELFACLVVYKDGRCDFYDEGFVPMVVRTLPMAIGTGSLAAAGALKAGAQIEEAMKIASELDSCTSPTFDILSIDDIKESRVKRKNHDR